MPKSLASIVAALLLSFGCNAVHILPVQTPDVINPVCVGSRIGIGATPTAREVAPISNRLSAEQTTVAAGYGTATRSKTVNAFQENVMEHVKGSHRRAVRNVTVDVTNLHIYALFYIADKLFVDVHGTVVELE